MKSDDILKEKMTEIALRIREIREVMDMGEKEMADFLEMSEEDYSLYESGKTDFPFTFLYNTAKKLGVDITELLTGDMPKLTVVNVTRAGEGLPISRYEQYHYLNLAWLFKDKISEPYFVTAKYEDRFDESEEIVLNYHEGQEFDYILEGSLRMRVDNHEFILNEGDSIYYDSSHGHGMVATGGKDCKFLAVVMKYSGGDKK